MNNALKITKTKKGRKEKKTDKWERKCGIHEKNNGRGRRK
jgi:hypothetical protein